MTTLYKLTDRDGNTRGATAWLPIGTTHGTDGAGELCGPGWLHAYTSPLLAVLLNPLHANIPTPRLFEAEGGVEKTDRGLKVGCRELKCIREIALPIITEEQRVRFAILCSLEVYDCPRYARWADSWLSGAEAAARSAAAAWSARLAEAVAWSEAPAEASALSEASAKAAAWSEASAEASAVAVAAAWSEASTEAAAWSVAAALSAAAWSVASALPSATKWPVASALPSATKWAALSSAARSVALAASRAARASTEAGTTIDFISLAQRAIAR